MCDFLFQTKYTGITASISALNFIFMFDQRERRRRGKSIDSAQGNAYIPNPANTGSRENHLGTFPKKTPFQKYPMLRDKYYITINGLSPWGPALVFDRVREWITLF
jgi:hypothetical protein